MTFQRSGGDDGLCVFCDDLLTFMTNKRIWIGARVVIPSSLSGLFNLCTAFTTSSIIRLTRLPVSEWRVTLIWPLPWVSEQTDPDIWSRWVIITNELLNLLILILVSHTDQISVILSAVTLSVSPVHRLIDKDESCVRFKKNKWKRLMNQFVHYSYAAAALWFVCEE